MGLWEIDQVWKSNAEQYLSWKRLLSGGKSSSKRRVSPRLRCTYRQLIFHLLWSRRVSSNPFVLLCLLKLPFSFVVFFKINCYVNIFFSPRKLGSKAIFDLCYFPERLQANKNISLLKRVSLLIPIDDSNWFCPFSKIMFLIYQSEWILIVSDKIYFGRAAYKKLVCIFIFKGEGYKDNNIVLIPMSFCLIISERE